MMRENFLKNAGRKMSMWASVLVLAGLIAACSDDFLDGRQNPSDAVAYVSFFHASPDAPGLTVSVDNRSVFSKIEYTDYSGYMNFYTGDRTFKVSSFNATNSLVDTTFNFTPRYTYSVFFIDQLSGMEALLVRDTAEVPANGKAMVRFVHLSPDTEGLDVKVEGQTSNLFTEQIFKKATGFKEINAGATSFDIKASGDDDVLLSADVTLKSGQYYTIITRGFSEPPQGNNNVLSVQVVQNN